MRLQLGGAVASALIGAAGLVAIGAPTAAWAQSEADVRVDTYTDDYITVITPSATARVEVAEGVEVRAHYTADIISGATKALGVDAISGATQFEETRHQMELDGSFELSPTRSLSVGLISSQEEDYQTYASFVSGGFEMFDRMSRLDARYQFSLEYLGSAQDPTLEELTMRHAVDLGWTQVLTRTATLSGLATLEVGDCGEDHGCNVSPYIYVPLMDDDAVVLSVLGRHPSLLVRGSFGARYSQYLGAGFALHAKYKGYVDTWQVNGHTADVALAFGAFGERLLLRLEGRGVRQFEASFFRKSYNTDINAPEVPEYRTGDRKLSGLWNGTIGGRVNWAFLALGPFSRLAVIVRVAHLWYRFPKYDPLPRLSAWLIGGGIHAEF